MHWVEVTHADGLEELQGTSEHLLSQPWVNREHNVVEAGVVGSNIAEYRQKEFFHLL